MKAGMVKVLLCAICVIANLHFAAPKADIARLQRIKPWDVKITANRYDILIGISDEIPENRGRRLIDGLKMLISSASKQLHLVTGGKTSFRVIQIVVPNMWTSVLNFTENGETTNKANIFVNKGELEDQEPEVMRYLKGSKKQFRSILLPDTYLLQQFIDPDSGRLMVEAWFQLQYGITKSFQDLSAEQVSTRLCINPQDTNAICKALRADLDLTLNTPSSVPTFRVVRQRSKRVVLIVDVSGSMYFNSRLDKAKEGLKDYIMEEKRDNTSSVGLVKFSTEAKTLSNLTITEEEKEQLLIIVQDLEAEYKTSIGAGLKEGIKILKWHNESTQGAEFILISDGEETNEPFINGTSTEVIDDKVTVHTIAITDKADIKMDALGAATGGLNFIHRDNEKGNDLGTAFTEISKFQSSDPAASGVIIYSERKTGTNPSFEILIDERIGRDTEFVFKCPYRNCQMNINMHSPSKQDFLIYEFTSGSTRQKGRDYEIIPNGRAGKLDIKIPLAEFGSWRVDTLYFDLVLTLTVKSAPRDASNYPILAFSFWGEDQIFADDCADEQTMYTLITRDNNPVTGANVKALVESTNATLGPFSLFDDGKGRDIGRNDGIYTGIFKMGTRKQVERFNMKVLVNGTAATQVQTRKLVGTSKRPKDGDPLPAPRPEDEEPVERLQRFVLGGSFMSMPIKRDACRVCNVDVVFLIHTIEPELSALKKFVFGIIEYLNREKNTRAHMGIISVRETPVIVSPLRTRALEVLSDWLFFKETASPGDQVSFSEALKSAGSLLSEGMRRKAVVFITEEDITSPTEMEKVRREVRIMRGNGFNIFPVGVGSGLKESILTEIAGDLKNVITAESYSALDNVQTKLTNLICGYTVEIPDSP